MSATRDEEEEEEGEDEEEEDGEDVEGGREEDIPLSGKAVASAPVSVVVEEKEGEEHVSPKNILNPLSSSRDQKNIPIIIKEHSVELIRVLEEQYAADHENK